MCRSECIFKEVQSCACSTSLHCTCFNHTRTLQLSRSLHTTNYTSAAIAKITKGSPCSASLPASGVTNCHISLVKWEDGDRGAEQVRTTYLVSTVLEQRALVQLSVAQTDAAESQVRCKHLQHKTMTSPQSAGSTGSKHEAVGASCLV